MRVNININIKHFCLIFFAIVLTFSTVLGIFFYYIYQNDLKNHNKLLQAKEKVQTDILLQTLAKDFRSTVSDLKIIARSHELTKFINNPNYQKDDISSDFRNIAMEKGLFDQIRYIDSNGQEQIRINYNNGQIKVIEESKLQNKSGRYYVDDTLALNRNEIFISPLDLNVEHGKIEMPRKPVIRFATPVFAKNNKRAGIVVLNYLAKPLLDTLESLTHNQMGHFALLNQNAYWLRGHDQNWEWAFMYENKRHISFASIYPDEWKKVLYNSSGQFISENGMFSYKTFYPLTDNQISSTGSANARGSSEAMLNPNEFFFKIIKHIPQDELEASYRAISAPLTYVYRILIFIIAIISLGLAYLIEAKIRINREREQLILDLQAALEEVQTLQGILPICSKCKKIRDDQGYWQQVDAYFANHSELQFSHGLCEKCAEELYGKEKWYDSYKKRIDDLKDKK